MIAWLHERLDEERAARGAAEKDLSDSKNFFRDRHLSHKARLKRSEDRNARLEAEVRTLRAQNESLKERLRCIERAPLRGLAPARPYRRLRSVGDDDAAGSR